MILRFANWLDALEIGPGTRSDVHPYPTDCFISTRELGASTRLSPHPILVLHLCDNAAITGKKLSRYYNYNYKYNYRGRMVPSFTLATPMFATTSSTPYLLVPQQKDSPSSSSTVKHYSPSFPIHLSGASKSPRNVAAEGALTNSQPQHHQQSSHNHQHASPSSRNVLAHKHAHHLHSIPPKQKNTKSLILDHFLWLHAMARIAQAAAELGVEQGAGMAGWGVGEGHAARIGDHDLRHSTATCASLHYNVHDDDDEYSRCVGETSAMGARTRNVGQARASRARAEGLEKVMAAMIGENPSTSTSSESLLPESVRFRFALGTLLNDVFTSRPFAPSPLSTDDDATPTESTQSRTRVIPDELAMLSRASLATPTERFSNILPSLSSLPLPKMNMGGSNSSFTWSQSHTSAGDQGFSLPAIVNRPKSPATHGKDLYNAGVQSSSSRCPRHLQHSCHSTCASLASPASLLNSTTAIGSGLSRLPGGSSFRWLQKGAGTSSERAQAPSTLEMIPHFLRLSAFVCIQLAQEREKEEEDETMDVDEDVVDTRPHRFHHLPSASTLSLSSISTSSSAELSSQNSGTAHHSSRESLPIDVDQRPPPSQAKRTLSFSLPFTRPSSVPSQPAQQQQQPQSQRPRSLKPAREWYALFAGLLTRAVLEGYLVRGWKSVQPAEVVFGIGLADNYGTSSPIKKKSKKGGLFSRKTEEEEEVNEKAAEQDMPAWSMPVDMPSLQEAMNVLFGAEDAEDQSVLTEFKAEMEKRLSEFLNISSQTSDLATHLESLLQKYPIEPVELAIMRFCESLLAWKGEPELEAVSFLA
ncbi:hypothetical protein CPB86DRAFT_45975 [Serendipita vermifera]|nr:hypothetical protein CPB86DRAFT_45975 [Serendipita vermifera]